MPVRAAMGGLERGGERTESEGRKERKEKREMGEKGIDDGLDLTVPTT